MIGVRCLYVFAEFEIHLWMTMKTYSSYDFDHETANFGRKKQNGQNSKKMMVEMKELNLKNPFEKKDKMLSFLHLFEQFSSREVQH